MSRYSQWMDVLAGRGASSNVTYWTSMHVSMHICVVYAANVSYICSDVAVVNARWWSSSPAFASRCRPRSRRDHVCIVTYRGSADGRAALSSPGYRFSDGHYKSGSGLKKKNLFLYRLVPFRRQLPFEWASRVK
jgi:hypothetical protein